MIALRMFLIHCLLFAGIATSAGQSAPADPPSRVGRLMMIEGSVKFYADQEEGWQPARLNVPVTGENSLWTEGRSRAEWRTGPAAIRLDHDTVLDVQRLDDTSTVLYLQRGAVHVRIGLIEKTDAWIVQTPEGEVSLRARGSYRIESDPDKGETRIAVLSGRARLESRGASPWIDAGRMALVERGSLRTEWLARTDFDDWSQARDEGLDPDLANHVSPHMTGYEDLGRYGTWEPAEEYGTVWYPSRIEEDWAPYRYGSWRYVRPWGWTWIDDAPWGFAPFHYGRWVQVRGRWGWWPGNRIYRPVYSPALVAWVGGDGWSLSIGNGSGPGIGWFPLAPWEAYVPWYSHTPRYVYNINHIHVGRPVYTHPPRDYRNFKPGATVVPSSAFGNRHPVWRERIRNPGESLWTQRPVQAGSVLPPRPSHSRPGPTKPGTLPSGNGATFQPPAGAPPATPVPLPSREVVPRHGMPHKPGQATPPGSGPGGQPGARPGPAPAGEPSTHSMPSRPAPSTPLNFQGAPLPSRTPAAPATTRKPATVTPSEAAPDRTAPPGSGPARAQQGSDSVDREFRPPANSRQRESRGAFEARPAPVNRASPQEGTRPDHPGAKPGNIDRGPQSPRGTPSPAAVNDRPGERKEAAPREVRPDKDRQDRSPERGEWEGRDRSDRSDRGDRTVPR